MGRCVFAAGIGLILLAAFGCDNSARIARLEKQNQELQEKLDKTVTAAAAVDLQAKCSQAAREWFGRNYTRDKDTVYLEFVNHYNAKLGKCFVMVEWHYGAKPQPNWYSEITVVNVFENVKFGVYSVLHSYEGRAGKGKEIVYECTTVGNKCNTEDEFQKVMSPYMSE